MIELVYMSHAKRSFSEEELLSLLHVARRNNKRNNITGMLLYDGKGTFIQAVEGDEATINRLLDTLKKDDRHDDIQELGRSHIRHRSFPQWEMGFSHLAHNGLADIEGYSDFMLANNEATGAAKYNGFAMQMLNHFKRSVGNNIG